MAYPAFLMLLLVVVIAGLMLFVLPRFAELYAQFGDELPAATRILMGAARAAPLGLPALLALAVGLWLLARRALRRPGTRRRADAVALRLPVLGPVARHLQLVQIGYMMSMLLGAGTPLREALGFVAQSVGNAAVEGDLRAAGDAIAAGRALSDALGETALFPPTSLSMIRAGEIAGSLPTMFVAVTALHEQQLEERMARLLALIEPVMMLLVGVVLGAVIITVYLPVFGLSGVIR